MDIDFGNFADGSRSRCWMLLLYPDDPILNDVLTVKLPSTGFDYAGRIHDQEGKPHYHIVLCFHNPRNAAGLTEALELDKRWMRPWDRKVKAFRYLCHKDNPEKFQYDTDGIFGSLTDDALKACANATAETEQSEVLQIIELLSSIKSYVSVTDFVSICASKGLWSTLRRMGATGTRLIDEHNSRLDNERRQGEMLRDASRFKQYVASGQSRNVDFPTWCAIMDKEGIIVPPLDD